MRVFGLLIGTAILGLVAGCGPDDASSPSATLQGSSRQALSVDATVSAATASGCSTASTSYPWGVAGMRTWTPIRTTELDAPNDAPGTAIGAPFVGRLVIAYGDDVGDSRRTAIFEMSDGCRRQFRAGSLSAADVALIDAEVRRHPYAPDPATYAREFIPNVTTPERLRDGVIGSYTTQHFAIWYGTKTGSQSYRWLRENGRDFDAYLREVGVGLERQWALNKAVVNAPMPFANDARKRKLDIFICGTGLPWYGTDDDVDAACGPSAADSMQAPAWDLLDGSLVAAHEFGHMLQFFSGGFRERGGPMWEVGAEWNSFTLSPTFGSFGADYQNNLESGPLFSHARYGAFPFVQYLFEKDNTRSLVWRAWRENLREPNGASQEEFIQSFVRLGQASGVYPNGFKSFADDMGWYGARLAAMDFLNQRTMKDAFRATRTTSWLSHFYTPLATVATVRDRTVFASPAQRPLLEWGTHIVPLTATAATVSATLTGGTTANGAAWRFTVVAVAADGKATYAPMTAVEGTGSKGTTLATIPAGTKLYLTVTATPSVFESLGWQPAGPTVGTKFPYRVRIVGATPYSGSPVPCNPGIQPGTWNLNYNTNGNLEGGKPC